ncbi:MAG: aminotransferase class V-fold PLP-dependent enzyme [Alphaproteobacteria bacterium]
MNKIIYLDAAATYQKSDAVIDAQLDFLNNGYANSGRGVCARAVRVDEMVENARSCVADFIGAESCQVVFTSGTTAGMNMVAQMLKLTDKHIVAVSDLDHHSARLPFAETGAKVVVCDLNESMDIDIAKIPYADVFIITAMSNVIGMPQDVSAIVSAAKQKNPNVITVVDAAQFVVHNKIDVKSWNCDFMCFSGHKIGTDTGLGILYIKNPDLYAPVVFGGGMVNKVYENKLILNSAPYVFEAGTLPLTQISGVCAAIKNIENNRPDLTLIKYMYDAVAEIPKVKIISPRDASVLSFVVDGMHVLDFGALIGTRGVCLRVGNMCASWIHKFLNIDGSIRISVGAYNTVDEIKQVIEYIKEIVR